MNGQYTKADYVQRWGHPTSVGIFDPACKTFSTPEINGIIGYRWQSKNAIVIGDPICSRQDLLPLINAFTSYCNNHNKKIIYLAISHAFEQFARAHKLFSCSIEIGTEIILDPTIDLMASTGKNASRLRNKYSLAIKDGLIVKEYTTYDLPTEQKIELVAQQWQQNRKGLQIYLSNLSVLADKEYKRYMYAEQHGRMIGVLILNRIDAHQGWFINMLILAPDAHNSASEFLILKALELLRKEECKHLSVGVNTTNSLGQLSGFSSFITWAARKAHYLVSKVFALDNRERYWNKFNPIKKPSFVLFTRKRVGLRDALDILYALNVGR